MVKVFDRDLAAASIPKQDDRGRTVDVHALRHTYGSLLSAGGVAPRTAQAAMRHSTIDLTMNVYTDPRLLDIAGALDSLPKLPLNTNPQYRQSGIATGTTGKTTKWTSGKSVAPNVAPTSVHWSNSRATDDNCEEKSLNAESDLSPEKRREK